VSLFDQDAPCLTDHDAVPDQYRHCPVCGEDLHRPGPATAGRGAVLSFPSPVSVHPLDVDQKPGIGDTTAAAIRTLRCLLLDLRDWARRDNR